MIPDLNLNFISRRVARREGSRETVATGPAGPQQVLRACVSVSVRRTRKQIKLGLISYCNLSHVSQAREKKKKKRKYTHLCRTALELLCKQTLQTFRAPTSHLLLWKPDRHTEDDDAAPGAPAETTRRMHSARIGPKDIVGQIFDIIDITTTS